MEGFHDQTGAGLQGSETHKLAPQSTDKLVNKNTWLVVQ